MKKSWNTSPNHILFLNSSYGVSKQTKAVDDPKNGIRLPSESPSSNTSSRSIDADKAFHQKTDEILQTFSNGKDKTEIYAQRLESFRNMCKNLRLTAKQYLKRVKRFIVDQTDKVIYVQIEKCGTRSWLKIFFDLHKKGKAIRYHARYASKYIQDMSRKYYIFAFVRHPFSRLLSAYRNKLEKKVLTMPVAKTFKPLQKLIVKKYRKVKRKGSKPPTFKEFIHFISDGGHLENPHWIPMHLRNFACNIRYDFLGKVESFSEDMDYLMNRFSWRGITPVWKNRSNHADDVQKYFSQISNNELLKLYNLYRNDFLLFNYTISPYDSYVQK